MTKDQDLRYTRIQLRVVSLYKRQLGRLYLCFTKSRTMASHQGPQNLRKFGLYTTNLFSHKIHSSHCQEDLCIYLTQVDIILQKSNNCVVNGKHNGSLTSNILKWFNLQNELCLHKHSQHGVAPFIESMHHMCESYSCYFPYILFFGWTKMDTQQSNS